MMARVFPLTDEDTEAQRGRVTSGNPPCFGPPCSLTLQENMPFLNSVFYGFCFLFLYGACRLTPGLLAQNQTVCGQALRRHEYRGMERKSGLRWRMKWGNPPTERPFYREEAVAERAGCCAHPRATSGPEAATLSGAPYGWGTLRWLGVGKLRVSLSHLPPKMPETTASGRVVPSSWAFVPEAPGVL